MRTGELPLHGLRIAPHDGTSGWFIWSGGAMSNDPEFFLPLHMKHVHRWSTRVLPYLALPPGSRFLIADDHEDVWFDQELLRREPSGS
ncbi:MAG TPA: hypothetical protein VFF12_08185 [Myxococcaceae bacterium]|nr:hypothetical protein [Myxococcaceae bacterium]